MSPNARSFAAILLIVLAIAGLASSLTAATEIDGKPNNPYGVQLGMWGGDTSDYASVHFQWARDLIGEWGHVRVGSGIHDMNIQGAVRTIAVCRAKHLIPVMTGLYVPEEYRIPGGGDHAPHVMKDYPKAAERYGQWAAELSKLGAVVPYYEVGNEINGKWEPEAYGNFIISVSKALKTNMPGVNVTSAGLAGNGADFLDDVLTEVPAAKDYVDCWGLHPYGANHPPAYTKGGYCLRGHFWTAEALKKHGISNPKFVMTESGYEIGNKRDNKYPRITDELRAGYIVEAYKTFWEPDPRVVSQMLFILHTAIFPGWDGWVLINTDGTKTKTYEAMAAIPKPQGSDWMPQGDCAISGRITDVASGQGLERVFVYTIPGIYAAETDENGDYTIENLPAGSYKLHVFRDGFAAPAPGSATVDNGKTATYNTSMRRVGYIADGMDTGEKIANGWLSIEGNPGPQYAVDTQVKRNGTASQRLTAKGAGEPVGVWQCTPYASAVPDRPFAAEVWVKGKGVKLGGGKGAVMSLSITDNAAYPYAVSEMNLPLEGDFDWTPITVTISPYPIARRFVVRCELDAAEGTVWFDDPYCHYAEYPVSSRLAMPRGTATVKGEVTAEKGEYMAEAVICLSPGNIWTLSRSDGTFELTDVPGGTYNVCAFKMGKLGVPQYGVKVESGGTFALPLTMRKPPAPSEVQNPGFEEKGPDMYFVPGWMKYREFDGIPENGWHPEVPGHPEGFSARTGEGFAGSIAGSNVKEGGIYQTIAVEPNKTYDVSVWIYTFQTDEGQRGDVASRLGVDPTGGTDPGDVYMLWTPFTPSHNKWTKLSLKVAPVEDRMTIFLETKHIHGLMFNLNMFDDVEVKESDTPLPPERMVTK